MRLVTRAQWGARPYRQPYGGITYSRARRGVKVHYLGTPYSDRPHERCDDYVRTIQAQHMDRSGWSDIGYSFVVCTHGYVYEGRGLKRRNSANGNTSLNEQDYAVLVLVGSSGLTRPTVAQLHGARDAIEHCREHGPAGTWIGGHRDGYATACPGDVLYAWVKKGAPRPSEESSMAISDTDAKRIARAVWETDGIVGVSWGSETNPEWKPESILNHLGEVTRENRGRIKEMQASLGALTEVVVQLAAGGGLDAAEIRAAAEAGAQAALDRLGDALTDQT
ncbi:N-acetylmuramoyl-L-alanine amidase [Streptomyces sp. CNQ085]|uniref:N-acetylmuramoyl-L-alanine amidase n=1 Tax=Streptomyces sp. CNQ085 TaxID=2886944 RepID=UPI001F505D64|nr:N-acetylmuramoyl-L-alanine amidase [Streptomyces sp. CNQ085]MCI0384596.1 N-acetylmuramoyl-L-alanine amidase [Streptomyces sp. CNQ085]